jgi:hypothetical protein
VPSDEPQRSTIDRYGDNEDEQSQANVSTTNKRGKQDSKVSKKRDKDKKKKKKKSKRDKEKRKSMSSSSKLVDRVPTVESCDSAKTQDVEGEKLQDDTHDLIASDDDGDDRYSIAGHLSRGGRSSAGLSVLSDDSDEYGARWRSWDDDEDVEYRENSPATDDELATTDDERKKSTKKKKKKKHRSKSKDKARKKKKKTKNKKSKQSEYGIRDQPEDHDNNPATEDSKKLTSTANDSLIQGLGATVADGQDHALIEEVEIEHIFTSPGEIEVTENITKNPVESFQEDFVDTGIDKKEGVSYNKSIILDDTFEIDIDDGVVNAFTTNKKELLELDEYSFHDLEKHSALGQCLRFYSCNGIARLLEFQPKLLPQVIRKDTNDLPTASANQNFELLLGVKSPVASDLPENIVVRGLSEDSLDMLHEAPSLDTIRRNPSVVVDLTGKNLCLDDESLEDQPSRKSGQGPRHRKRNPRSNHKITVTSIVIPDSKLKKGKMSAKSPTDGDKSDKTLQVKNKKAPTRGLWLKRRLLDSDDKSVSSVRSAASSRASMSTVKKRSVQSFFLRMQGKRAQC